MNNIILIKTEERRKKVSMQMMVYIYIKDKNSHNLISQLRLNPVLCIMNILFEELYGKSVTLPTSFCFSPM